MAQSTINASIVTYHTPPKELTDCLKSMLATPAIAHVDVIDNASEQSIAQVCATFGDSVSYQPNPNVGFGRAHNISLRRSIDQNADYHLVINADVYFDPGTIEACLDYMQQNPDVGQLIPRTEFPGGEYQPTCHPVPSPLELMLHRFTPLSWCRRRRDRYELDNVDMTVPHNVPVHHGCFMFLRVSVLKEIGIFDERFFMYGEDFDLTRRIHRHYRTMHFPGAKIVHLYKAESRVSTKLFIVHCLSMLKYFAKWGFLFDKERTQFNRALQAEINSQSKR